MTDRLLRALAKRVEENRMRDEAQLAAISAFFANAEYCGKNPKFKPEMFMIAKPPEEAPRQMSPQETVNFLKILNVKCGGRA